MGAVMGLTIKYVMLLGVWESDRGLKIMRDHSSYLSYEERLHGASPRQASMC